MHQAARWNSEARLPEGKLVALCADWRDELFPCTRHPSRPHPPARTRAFHDCAVALPAR